MKKLTYFILACAIITSYSTTVRAADSDSDSDELNLASHSRITRITDSDKLGRKKSSRKPPTIAITEEGEHEGVVYVKQSRLRKIIFSSPGEHEIKGYSESILNGYKYVKLKNEEGKKVPFIFLNSFERKYKSRFPKDNKLIPCHMTALFPKASVWGVSVELPPKKRSHRKHRSKRINKPIPKTKSE